jgi:single-strand DNA-binding protein
MLLADRPATAAGVAWEDGFARMAAPSRATGARLMAGGKVTSSRQDGPTRWRRKDTVATENQITLAGELLNDPLLLFTSGGTRPLATFRIAVDPTVDGGVDTDGEPPFVTIRVWDQQGENVAEALGMGMRCVVVGRLRPRVWENALGELRTSFEIDADEVALSLGWGSCG